MSCRLVLTRHTQTSVSHSLLYGSPGRPYSHLPAPEGLTLNSVTSDSSLISSPAPQPLILEQIFSYPPNG